MRFATVLVPAIVVLGVTASSAQQSDSRYTLEKSANGYVRMDKQSGEMSICEERAGQLICKMAADDRQAFESELERLQSTVDALGARVSALESGSKSALPSDEEFDKTMTYMQRFFRGFMDIVKEFDGDQTKPQEPSPQRT